MTRMALRELILLPYNKVIHPFTRFQVAMAAHFEGHYSPRADEICDLFCLTPLSPQCDKSGIFSTCSITDGIQFLDNYLYIYVADDEADAVVLPDGPHG